MKDIRNLYSRFESINEPEVSEETLGAYIEGNLSAVEAQDVANAISASDHLYDIINDDINDDILLQQIEPWISDIIDIDDLYLDAIESTIDTTIYDYAPDDIEQYDLMSCDFYQSDDILSQLTEYNIDYYLDQPDSAHDIDEDIDLDIDIFDNP